MTATDAADFTFLRRAFEIARRARQHGNHPFRALLVDTDGAVLIEMDAMRNRSRAAFIGIALAVVGPNADAMAQQFNGPCDSFVKNKKLVQVLELMLK